MKNLIIATTLLISTFTFANGLKIEPLYGIERSHRLYPEPAKVVTRTYLGVRGTYGTPALAGELELAQSSDTDTFPTTNETVKYEAQRAMLGLRSYPIKSKFVGMYIRGGVRAKKEERTVTDSSGNSTSSDTGVRIDPYAGAGLTIGISNFFALNAGATLVYNDNAPAGEDKFDQQLTFSFTIKAGNR